jgi:hypothetical protein
MAANEPKDAKKAEQPETDAEESGELATEELDDVSGGLTFAGGTVATTTTTSTTLIDDDDDPLIP